MSGVGRYRRDPVETAEVCVIGAGPAGALVADSLTPEHDVTVLDAGPRFSPSDRHRRQRHALRPAFDRPDVWGVGGRRDAHSTGGERFYPLNHARVKGLGGSTLHWQGMVMRLHEDDFASRSTRGVGVDWPIEYDDLRPYYAASERALGVSGSDDNPFTPPREEPFPLAGFEASHSDELFERACDRLGIEMHSVPNARTSAPYDGRPACTGYGTCQPVCPSRAKYDATVHLERAERHGATVLARSPVHYLDHNAERVTAAVYDAGDGRERRVEADAFVIACGGVETPRLLLLSASRFFPEGLANTSGRVGRYFMDHLFAGMGGTVDEPTRQHHVGFITRESHQFYDDADAEVGPIKLEFLNYAGPSPLDIALNDDTWGDELLERIRERYGSHLGLGGLVEQLPSWESYIGLDPHVTDDRGHPVPEIHWSVDERALRTIERANEIQRSILDELGAEVTWRVGPETSGPAYHHMGTTRMGNDSSSSVVDAALRTHDLDNCWIASSAVFPTGGAMNPTLTIAALSLRLAESIEARLGA